MRRATTSIEQTPHRIPQNTLLERQLIGILLLVPASHRRQLAAKCDHRWFSDPVLQKVFREIRINNDCYCPTREQPELIIRLIDALDQTGVHAALLLVGCLYDRRGDEIRAEVRFVEIIMSKLENLYKKRTRLNELECEWLEIINDCGTGVQLYHHATGSSRIH